MLEPIPVVVRARRLFCCAAKSFCVRLGLEPSQLETMTSMTTLADLKATVG